MAGGGARVILAAGWDISALGGDSLRPSRHVATGPQGIRQMLSVCLSVCLF